MFLVVGEYSEVSPIVLYSSSEEMAEHHFKTASTGCVRVTIFKQRENGFGFDEIKTSGKLPR